MLSQRLNEIKPFRVMEVLARAQELQSLGHHVLHFEVGEPDFSTAEPIVEAGVSALRQGHTKYTEATGIASLRQAIADHYAAMGITVGAERIVVTSGASAGLALLSALLLNPGDELLITDPGYPCNEVFVHLTGAVPRAIPVGPNSGFQPSAEDVAAHWSAATRGVLLASPANPTGVVLNDEQLLAIGGEIDQRQGFLILDEIYQGIRRQGQHSSGLKLRSDAYILNSFSKYFGMTGWRLGWVVLPEFAIEGATKLCQNLFICPSAPAQHAAIEAFSPASIAIHEERVAHFNRRCELLYSGLMKLGFTIPVYPQGAFYLYVDVSHTGLSSSEFCARLLDEFYIATTPGEDFGRHQADRYVRFAFTTSEQDIAEALVRIEQALDSWAGNAAS